jgi:hypothetical protein
MTPTGGTVSPPQLNEALWRDLERRLGTSDLLDWLETEAERLANMGRVPSGAVEFSPALLRDRRICWFQAKADLPAAATIRWRTGGYEVAYRPVRRIDDQRFWIAHEIAHTLWFAPHGAAQPLSPLQRAIGDDPTIEWLCNRTAAAILVPRCDLVATVRHVRSALGEIPELARRYVVPERLIARRLFHELVGTGLTVLCVRVREDRGSSRQAELVWCASSPGGTVPNRKKATRRIIPLEMLPDVPAGVTREVEVDGRWEVLVESVISLHRASPLKMFPPLTPRSALVARTSDAWYFGLEHSPKAGGERGKVLLRQ